ncbi:hypothetical protein [Sulfitobacter sp. 1A15299]|uniref:hypothetical protein n=1 Tax=Sulfitobacter sp. 1A15299 TaxID=3368598 RepID=UPI0037470781
MGSAEDYFEALEKADEVYNRQIAELDRADPDYWSDMHHFMAVREVSAELNSMSDRGDVQNYLGFIARTNVNTVKSNLDTQLILRIIYELQTDLKRMQKRQSYTLILTSVLTGAIIAHQLLN